MTIKTKKHLTVVQEPPGKYNLRLCPPLA